MARIQIERSFRSLVDLELVTKADMREIGTLARERIVTRTRTGMGVDGAFAPLSAGYAKRKAQAGLPPIPNLTASGRMLNDFTIVAVEDDSVTLGWNT